MNIIINQYIFGLLLMLQNWCYFINDHPKKKIRTFGSVLKSLNLLNFLWSVIEVCAEFLKRSTFYSLYSIANVYPLKFIFHILTYFHYFMFLMYYIYLSCLSLKCTLQKAFDIQFQNESNIIQIQSSHDNYIEIQTYINYTQTKSLCK